ncbi:MAG: PQQ-like beta-propeller repeat protein [Planctomycetaceae bacterium]|nr:PQQ-like beta-propeller repeat protein [Planctomycetaceae bacterium]
MLLCLIGLLLIVPDARAEDWPQWGGPKRDLVWREKGIVKKLPTSELLPRVWSTPIKAGYAGPAVANGRVFITDYDVDHEPAAVERVLCLDAKDGSILWKHQLETNYTVSYPAGPRATPVVDGNRVYTIGTMGNMFCFDVENGKIIWQKDFVKDYSTRLPTWGMAASPLIDGDQLITLVGGADDALIVSFDKFTGKEIWRSLTDKDVGYSPPMIYTFNGIRQLIAWHPGAVSSINPANGKKYWEIPFPIRVGLCISTPRQLGNRLFVTAFYNGPMMIEVQGKTAKIVWKGDSENEIKTDGLHCIMSTPFVNKTHIYGVGSYGALRCLKADTGERVWETFEATGEDRWWNAFIISHEDRFFLHNEQGDLIIANLTPQGYQELSRAKLIEPTRKVKRRLTIWSHPAFAMKSIFARNDNEIIRVNLSAE